MKVLVTGARGMLGTDILQAFKSNEIIGLSREELDITNLNDVLSTVRSIKPDVVINCAAYTKVDDCETNVELAYKVNAIGPRNLAVACEENNCALLHISTDYVFDGTAHTPYKEDAMTNPLGVYGKSKLAGEQFIRELCTKFYIVRTSWLYGKNGPNFVETMLKLAQTHLELRVVHDQIGSPTVTKDLAEAIYNLIQTPAYGIYHLTNSGTCSWYEFAREIFDIKGINVKVNPITTEEFPRPAPRPKYSVMDNFCWRLQGMEPLRDYKVALKEYLSNA